MTKPTWEECRAANMSCREAAEARGVSSPMAWRAANKRGWKWRDVRREASRARMTALHQDPTFAKATAARITALNVNPDFRAAASARVTAMNKTQESHDAASARMTALHQDPAFKAAHAARGRAMMIAMNSDPNIRTPARLAAMAAKASVRMTAMNQDPAFNPLVLLSPSERVWYDDLIRKCGSTRAQVLTAIGRADLVRDVGK